NFRSHAVGLSLEPLLRGHDRSQFDLACYAQLPSPDAASDLFRQYAQLWRPIAGLSDEEVARQIAVDDVDILVSVAGWFDGNRPLICAFKPAPVQVTIFDGASSGISAIDYWLTDGFLHPGEAQDRFVETLVRVPHLIVYPPLRDLPPIGPVPSSEAAGIVFGSCNNPAKLTDSTIALWARVLRAVAGSRLRLKYLNWFDNPRLRRRIAARFLVHGVGEQQLAFISGDQARPEHFRQIDRFDVALDSFPFNGCTTTFEALCMGVPVVTLAGERYVSRMSGSLLETLGLRDLIATSPDDFVARAVAVAHDSAYRRRLRESLRSAIAASRLCDASAFARSVEDAYRQMWRDWCARGDS
ncbi:MAG: hypothetical protein FJX52_04125, partial [Alphaproteobacteria bacterium]|nr:hypothetical protein [Alphaproteobacteria bacterium]